MPKRDHTPGTPNTSVRCHCCANYGTNMSDGTVILFHKTDCVERDDEQWPTDMVDEMEDNDG